MCLFLELGEIHLCFNKVRLKVRTRLVSNCGIHLTIFLVFTSLIDKPILDADELGFSNQLAHRRRKIRALVEPLNENIEGFLCIVWKLEWIFIFHNVCCGDMVLVGV